MTIGKFIKPAIISLAILSSCAVNAISLLPASTGTDYNYVGVRAGGVFPGNTRGNSDLQSVSADTTYTAGIAVGRKIMDRFSVEIEYMNRGESDLNSSSLSNSDNVKNSWGVSSNTLMLNLAVDVITGTPITPYLKFGMGASRNEASQYIYSDSTGSTAWGSKASTKFAWQTGFGVNMSVTKTTDANIEYAYIDRGEFRTKNGSTFSGSGLVINNSEDSPKLGKLREQVLTAGFKLRF